MKRDQLRAIWYADRERKLKKLEALGLLREYEEFNRGKKNNTIAVFCRRKGIIL